MKKVAMAMVVLSMVFAFGIMNVWAQQVTWDDPYTQSVKLKELAADSSLYGIQDSDSSILVVSPSITVAGTTATGVGTTAVDIATSPKGTVFAITAGVVGTWDATTGFTPLLAQPKIPTLGDGENMGTYKHIALGEGGKLYVLYENEAADAWYILIGHAINNEMTVSIEPKTLNLGSKGNFVNCKITLPNASASDIDPDTVEITKIAVAGGAPSDLETPIPASQPGASPTKLNVKFSRQALSEAITALLPVDATGKVPVTVTVAAEANGEWFEGTATFNALVPKPKKK